MRDPDLVQRAEQAAAGLEQAWMRWRARHGLGSGPLPPVSSYVGYSVEEPWGQPRVVLGVEASEAERLAAILDGHECGEKTRAVSGGPAERHAQAESGPVRTALDGDLPISAQPVPAQPVPAQPSVSAKSPVPAEPAVPAQPSILAQPASPAQPSILAPPPRHAAREPWPAVGGPVPAHPAAQAPQTTPAGLPVRGPDDAAARLEELAVRSAARPPMAQAFPTAPLLPVATSGPAELSGGLPPVVAQPPVVALRPGPDAQDQAGVTQARLAGPHDEPDSGQEPAGDPARARLLPVSRLNRQRRPPANPGSGPWPAVGSHQADTAV